MMFAMVIIVQDNFLYLAMTIPQTVPVIAMLAILMLVMGLGPTTVVVTVFLYALLPNDVCNGNNCPRQFFISCNDDTNRNTYNSCK
jgi:hypothetical protein